jgi:hypothetical protein
MMIAMKSASEKVTAKASMWSLNLGCFGSALGL